MAYTPPTGSINASWLGASPYLPPKTGIWSSWAPSTTQHVFQPQPIAAPGASRPTLKWGQFIAPLALEAAPFGITALLTKPWIYRPPQFAVNATWFGANAYSPSSGSLAVSWDVGRVELSPVGIDPEEAGSPVVFGTQFLRPSGFDLSAIGDSFALFSWQYAPPEWIIDASWVGRDEYDAPHGELDGLWTLPSESKYLPLTGWDSMSFGAPSLVSMRAIAAPPGIPPAGFGSPNLRNGASALRPAGIAASAFGLGLVFNLRQYARPPGIAPLSLGSAYVSGGVKTVSVTGLLASAYGSVVVVNTRASQRATPPGIPAPGFGAAHVSPRTIFAFGFIGAMGTPQVQRNPNPVGFNALAFGYPVVDYKTKRIGVAGIEPGDFGFPRVFDPTQKLSPPSMIQAGVFGDTRIANNRFVIRPAGQDFAELSSWAGVLSNRRYLQMAGLLATELGTAVIFNKTPSIAPPGFDSSRPPSPTGTGIGYSRRFISPAGLSTMVLGRAVLTKTPSIAPAGIAGAMGSPTVWPRVRRIEARGHNSALFGAASAWFRFRFVAAQGFAPSLYGVTKIEHSRRQILGAGYSADRYGSHAIGNADRTISPPSIYENFATGHMVGGLRFLRPVGYEATRFGSRIIPEIQAVYPLGFAGLYGLATIFNFRKVIAPAGITTGVQPADRWGTPRAWNLRQYVVMSYDPDSALNPPAWPQWTKIENRTRVVRATGQESLRIGDQQIDNKARPLYAQGIAAPSTPESYRAGMVAFRVRPFRLEGIEPPYLSTWASVRNTAAVLKPAGSVATLFGNSAIANTRRNFERIGGFDSAWYGYPMVAERVRTLSFEGRYTIGSPVIPLPEIKLHTRYVDGIGYDASGIGWASLSIHWTLITPRWTLQNLYGFPEVRNVTPELRTRGRASDEFGNAFVRLEWRPVAPEGSLTQLFGKTGIAYRDRTLFLSGFRAGALGDKLTVVKTGAPPYSMQFITLEKFDARGGAIPRGDGIPPESRNNEQVPPPIINQQVLYVRQTEPSTLYGSHRVTANSVRVEPGIGEYLVGEPFVALKVRELKVAEFPQSQVFHPAKPRLSPHTIYAVVEAPEQAIRNHPVPGISLHYVNGWGRQPGAIFGRAEVMLRHRIIYPRGFANNSNSAAYGRPTLQLKRHYITPTGFTTFRAGWHTVPGTQTVTQFDSAMMSMYGAAKVEHYVPPGPRTVKPTGLNAQAFGANRIDLFHREVKPQGHYATLMGTRKPGDSPYMWQGLRVGPLMPTIPSGAQTDLYGEPWVSFRVREIKPAGYDAFRCEYQLEAFDQRMRVYRAAVARPARSIGPVGFSAFASAASAVRAGRHYIRPDGNADQYRKGAF